MGYFSGKAFVKRRRRFPASSSKHKNSPKYLGREPHHAILVSFPGWGLSAQFRSVPIIAKHWLKERCSRSKNFPSRFQSNQNVTKRARHLEWYYSTPFSKRNLNPIDPAGQPEHVEQMHSLQYWTVVVRKAVANPDERQLSCNYLPKPDVKEFGWPALRTDITKRTVIDGFSLSMVGLKGD